MSPKLQGDATAAFEQAAASAKPQSQFVLRLYVAGATQRSVRAIASIKKICEEHLEGRYELSVIDLYQQPVLAKGDQIVATPTLIKELPAPLRRMIGDLSNVDRVLVGLNLKPKPKGAAKRENQR